MPIPNPHTEAELAEYLHRALRNMATLLGWSVAGGDYTDIVEDTLLAYGVPDIDQALDPRKLRALGKIHVWKAVVATLAASHTVSMPGTALQLGDLQRQASVALEEARNDAVGYGLDAASVATIDRVLYVDDPYAYLPPEERML